MPVSVPDTTFRTRVNARLEERKIGLDFAANLVVVAVLFDENHIEKCLKTEDVFI